MSTRIKGITIEIGSDATGLDKSLKGVKSTIFSTNYKYMAGWKGSGRF